MIIVKIQGGLGNQLFQYAFARRLAYTFNTSFKLDISNYDPSPKNNSPDKQLGRAYVLNKFSTLETYASNEEINTLIKYKRRPGNYIYNRIIANKLIYIEEIFPLSKDYLNPPRLQAGKDVYLDGYWISEKYFKDIEPVIRTEFTLKTHPDAINGDTLKNIEQSESVCLHIRRGDFVLPQYKNHLGVCPPEYYESAIKIITKQIKKPHFFIFSDDIPWVKENIKIEYPTTYIDHNGPHSDYEDLRLMSKCKYFIIANSSFSWWGAWLSQHREKIVVAPNKLRKNKIWKDFIPESWIQIETELI